MKCMCIFQLCFPQDICPVVGLLGYIIVLVLVFWGISIMFYIMAISICIPTKSARRFPFLHTLSNIYCLWIFYDGHSDWSEVIPHCNFDLHCSNNEQCWAFFMCFLAMYIFLWRNFCLGLLLTFSLGCLFLCYWAEWAANIFWRSIFCQLFPLLLFSAILKVVFSLCL